MENKTNALLPTKIDGRSVMKTIKQSDPLDLAIWKLMSDSRKRTVHDIALELREYGFRQEDVKDRVVSLHCSANRRWFNHQGSGKNTTYQLRKNRLERPFARGGVDIESISNIRDVLIIADTAAQVFAEVDAKPTEGNELYKELMSSQGFNPCGPDASTAPVVIFSGQKDFDLDAFLAQLPHEIDKNDAEWLDIVRIVAEDRKDNLLVVVNALGEAGVITAAQFEEVRQKVRDEALEKLASLSQEEANKLFAQPTVGDLLMVQSAVVGSGIPGVDPELSAEKKPADIAREMKADRLVPNKALGEVDMLSNGQPFVSKPGALDAVRGLVAEQWPDAKILKESSGSTLPNKSGGETEFSDGYRAAKLADPSLGQLSPDTIETILNAPSPLAKAVPAPTEMGSIPDLSSQTAEARPSQNQETNMSQFPLDPTANTPKTVVASVPVYKRDDVETAIVRLLRLAPRTALSVREITEALEQGGIKQPYSGIDYRVRKMLATGVIARNPEKNTNSVWTHYFVPDVAAWNEKHRESVLELVTREKEIADSGEAAVKTMEVFNSADQAPAFTLPHNDWLIRPESSAPAVEDGEAHTEERQATSVPYSKEPVIVIRGLVLTISEAKELKQFVEKQSDIKVPGFLAKTKMLIQGIEFTFEQIEEIGFELASLF